MSRLDDPEFDELWDRLADTLQEDHDLLRALLERVADLEARVARLEEGGDDGTHGERLGGIEAALHRTAMGTKRSSIRHRARRDAVVAQLLERDGDRCWYCGCRFGDGARVMTLDHVEPLSDGGRSKSENLHLCCRTCNRRKGAMGAEAYLASKLLATRRRQIEAEEAREEQDRGN